jgi:glycine/D-amino acid oxidase-like deaminating enzyme
MRADCVVIGGGLFGCHIAALLEERHGCSVVLVERESALMQRASHNNQARIHMGYHYPRSILTGLRSRVNSARFMREFADCIDERFTMYYAVARPMSNVTAAQFEKFCERIGAPLEPAPDTVQALFEPRLIEAVYRVVEPAFDAVKLARRVEDSLRRSRVEILLGCEVQRLSAAAAPGAAVRVHAAERGGNREISIDAAHVFNCAYSNINTILSKSGLARIPLKQELAEVALVRVPRVLQDVGVTVMCGPFFSFMPFPARGLHSFSHVRYTPHHAWLDVESNIDNQEYMDHVPKRTNFPWMQADARRYVPLVEHFEHEQSLWELKCVLPQSEHDDSRPILFQRNVGLRALTCVLGGKIDNMYDVDAELEAALAGGIA